jgi:hypothetical protein
MSSPAVEKSVVGRVRDYVVSRRDLPMIVLEHTGERLHFDACKELPPHWVCCGCRAYVY